VLAVGETTPFRIHVHCGFQYTEINGELWRTNSRDDVRGTRASPQVVIGTIERTSEDRAVFVTDDPRVRAVFRPAPNDTYLCQ